MILIDTLSSAPPAQPILVRKFHPERPMKKIGEYLRHADECRDMARTAQPAHRQQLVQMAETWEQLAEARRQQLNKLGSNRSET
ncbi:MAG: hypothetical protein WAK90_04045 [Pseudolabrys sp.]|jgi:flagellar biosynthesis/type III secretory pathway ATPase